MGYKLTFEQKLEASTLDRNVLQAEHNVSRDYVHRFYVPKLFPTQALHETSSAKEETLRLSAEYAQVSNIYLV
jgi:hypothetical protein